MNIQVQVENPSKTTKKITVTVPKEMVNDRFDRTYKQVQKTAKIKGFRQGAVPMPMVKKFYGSEVNHQLYHDIVDESFREAVREHKFRPVGRPSISMPGHEGHDDDHDHSHHHIEENAPFTFVATFEVLPEIDLKKYKGLSLKKEKVEVNEKDVKSVVDYLMDSQAELVAAGSGLVGADGKSASSRALKNGDFASITFQGKILLGDGKFEERPEMKGDRMVEVGAGNLLPAFEENLLGMKAGEKKTFTIKYDKDYPDESLREKDAEFTVELKELKEKKLPELNDEFAKKLGYENVSDLQAKAKEHVTREREKTVDRKLRSDLLQALIEGNNFDCPKNLVQAQTKMLIEEFVEDLKKQGLDQNQTQELVGKNLEALQKKAENQVRSSLLLDQISQKEEIKVEAADVDQRMKDISQEMRVDLKQVQDFYSKNQDRLEDLHYQVREEKTIQFLISEAKIKE